MVFVGVLVILGVGFSAIAWYRPRLHTMERLALSYLLGVGLVTLAMFWLSVVGLSFKLSVLLPILIGGALLSLFLAWRRGFLGSILRQVPTDFQRRLSLLEVVLLTILAATVFLMVVNALIAPLASGADPHSRCAVALAFAKEKTIQIDDYSPLHQIAHPEYPLLTQLFVAFLLLFQPEPLLLYGVNFMFIFPLFYLALLTIFYFRLRAQVRSGLLVLLGTVILGSTPLIVYMGYVFSMNMPAVVYLCAGVLFLYAWWEEGQSASDLWLPGALLGLLAWTRFEGLLYGLPPLVLAMWLGLREFSRGRVRINWQFFGVYVLIAFAWYLYRYWRWDELRARGAGVDQLLVEITAVLILGYWVFARYGARTRWGSWLICQLYLMVPISIVLIVSVTVWHLIRDAETIWWRLQQFYNDFTRSEWGGLHFLVLLLPFVPRRVIERWYLFVIPLWVCLIWVLTYVTSTLFPDGAFTSLLGSVTRTLLYFYPLFLFAVTRLLSADRVGDDQVALEAYT